MGPDVGGPTATARVYWQFVLRYARLFQEEPALRALGRELDARTLTNTAVFEQARATALGEMVEAHAFIRTQTELIAARAGTSPSESAPPGSDPAEDPDDAAEHLLGAANRLLHTWGSAFDSAGWAGHEKVVTSARARWVEVRRTEGLLTASRECGAWTTIAEVGRAPEAGPEVQGAWLTRIALAGRLRIEPEFKVLANRLPSDPEWHLRLRSFHQWIVRQLRSGQLRYFTFARYKESTELLQRPLVQGIVGRRDAGTNNDERELRDHLALYFHDRGFRVTVEPLVGEARPDLVAAYRAGGMELPTEVKVVRAGDSRSRARDQLQKGMIQALAYTRRADCDQGFLVVYWLADLGYDIPPVAHFADCVIHVFILDFRQSPSTARWKESVRVQDWMELVYRSTP